MDKLKMWLNGRRVAVYLLSQNPAVEVEYGLDPEGNGMWYATVWKWAVGWTRGDGLYFVAIGESENGSQWPRFYFPKLDLDKLALAVVWSVLALFGAELALLMWVAK